MLSKARSNLRFPLLACLVLLLCSSALSAQVDPSVLTPQDRRPVDAKFFQHSDLTIGNQLVAPTALRSSEASSALTRLAGLGTEQVAAVGRVDRRGDRFGTVLLSKPLLPGSNALTWAGLGMAQPTSNKEVEKVAWKVLRSYLETHAGALRVDLDELDAVKVTVHSGGDFIQVSANRRLEGLTVRGAGFSAAIRMGNLSMYGFHRWGDVVVPTPTLAAGTAADQLTAYLAPITTATSWSKSELTLIPVGLGDSYLSVDAGQGYHHRLAWTLYPILSGDLNSYKALVDANSGQILEFRNAGEFLSVDDTDKVSSVSRGAGASTRELIGGVYPKSNDGDPDGGVEQPMWPMPFATVTTPDGDVFTDSGGQLPACYDGSISTALVGRYLTISDTCGAINETDVGNIDMGTSGGIDCTVPGGASLGDTHSSRSAFYEIGRMQEMARAQLPGNAWLQSSDLLATVNIAQNCNATSGGNLLRFFTSGGGCSNTGELAGVFDHEWGHSMDSFDATPGVSSPGEGIADIYASLRLNDSCMGRNFLPTNCGGYGDPCTDCTGVRDINFDNRASGLPHDIAFIDTCGPGQTNGPCGGSVHCESAVYSEAVWDIWHRDLQAQYGTDLDSARELAALLSFQGSGAVGNWFSCNAGSGTGDGCNADGGYLNYLAIDDDDGNLMNGTPHMQAIFDAFDRHDIACATPTVQDSGCAGSPTTASTVTLTPLDRAISLSWTAVASTTTYQIFRAEGISACDYGKVLIGEVDNGTTSFVDTGLRNGRDYSYIVIPKGGSASCFGPSSSCQTTQPVAGANLSMLASQATFTPDAGDGDVFVDNGEVATLSIPIQNLGNGSSTNVRLVSATVTSHPGFAVQTAPGTVFSATVSACAEGTADIQVLAAGLNGLGDVVDIEVQITSDELSPFAATQTFSFNNTNGNFVPEVTFTFDYETDGGSLQDWTVTEGTFELDGPGDGASANRLDSSDGLDNQCDRVVSPQVILSATSTMAMSTNFDIEAFGGNWWDRANVAILHADGSRTVIDPDGGRMYNASGGAPFSGCTTGENGWADAMTTWAPSSWTSGALGITPGEVVRIEVSFGTDGAAVGRGLWFDNLILTDFELAVPETADIFSDGFESGGTGQWSSTNP